MLTSGRPPTEAVTVGVSPIGAAGSVTPPRAARVRRGFAENLKGRLDIPDFGLRPEGRFRAGSTG